MSAEDEARAREILNTIQQRMAPAVPAESSNEGLTRPNPAVVRDLEKDAHGLARETRVPPRVGNGPAPAPAATPTPTRAPAPAPVPSTPAINPGASTRAQKLAELLEAYRADKIGPTEYHQQRAKILAEP